MGRQRVVVLYSHLLAKVSEHVVVEFLSIVRDEDLRNSKSTKDAFPDKATNIFLHDGC